MLTWIIDTLFYFLTSIGVLLGFIAILYVLQKLTCGLAVKEFGGKSIYLSAWIGTPIHEISHALLCIIFGHKINEIALFKPQQSSSGSHGVVLGYVTHSYNRNNLIHEIGNFFIGIAPLFGGVLSIVLLTLTLLPDSQPLLDFLAGSISDFQTVSGLTTFTIALQGCINDSVKILYLIAQLHPVEFITWAYITGAIALHMSPSPADMKGSIKGFLLILGLLSIGRYITHTMDLRFFDVLSNALLPVSVMFTLCIILAAILALFIYLLSLAGSWLRKQK